MVVGAALRSYILFLAVVSRETVMSADVNPQVDLMSWKVTGTVSTVELTNDLWTCPRAQQKQNTGPGGSEHPVTGEACKPRLGRLLVG